MRQWVVSASVILSLAGAVLAHQGVNDPGVKARMDGMKDAQSALVVLGEMAKGTTPFNAEKAEQARDQLARALGEVPALFEIPHDDPLTEALPAIWQDWPDYLQKSRDSRAAAAQLNLTDAVSLRQSLGEVAQTCGACHQDYRIKKP